jgi:hypothetical protein
MTTGFSGKQYLSLETFRANGTGVRTPVWFAEDAAHTLFVYSRSDAGKVKRVHRNRSVRIAACTMRGTVTGPWVDADARIVTGEEAAAGMRLLNRKYWPWKGIGDFFGRLLSAQPRAVLAIRPPPGP